MVDTVARFDAGAADMRPSIILYVPVPPSANAMFGRAMTRKGRRVLTPAYMEWRDRAGWIARTQVMGAEAIACRFDVHVEVPPGRIDLDNYLKPLLDLCQNIHAITNDRNQNDTRIVRRDRTDVMIALTPRPDLGMGAMKARGARTTGTRMRKKAGPGMTWRLP